MEVNYTSALPGSVVLDTGQEVPLVGTCSVSTLKYNASQEQDMLIKILIRIKIIEIYVWVIAWGRVKLRINITRVFRNCRNCPSRAATRAISAISENTSDINP